MAGSSTNYRATQQGNAIIVGGLPINEKIILKKGGQQQHKNNNNNNKIKQKTFSGGENESGLDACPDSE
jgi:hypothetical protein